MKLEITLVDTTRPQIDLYKLYSLFEGIMSSTGRYSQVSQYEMGGAKITARLAITASGGPTDAISLLFKGALLGASLFTLSPLITVDAEQKVSYDLNVIWPNGVLRNYQTSCKSSVTNKVFEIRFNEALYAASEKCFTNLANRMSADFDSLTAEYKNQSTPYQPVDTAQSSSSNSTSKDPEPKAAMGIESLLR